MRKVLLLFAVILFSTGGFSYKLPHQLNFYQVSSQNNVLAPLQSLLAKTNLRQNLDANTSSISFRENFISVSEDAGSVAVTLELENPSASSFDLVLKEAPFSNTNASDITYTSTTITLTGTSSITQTITIPIKDDAEAEMDEYFILSLENLNNVNLSGKQYLTVYIKDNDRAAPVPTEEIRLKYVESFKPAATGSTEIVVHDPVSQRLFMTSAIEGRLDIADFSDPSAITLVKSIDMAPYGGITSVAVRNGVVAVASPAPVEQDNGSVVFFNTDGEFQKQVTVGALPDMITFSPDGNKILTANEGQPNNAYTIDPEGSISVIDISGGLASVDQSKVTTISFAGFNAQEAALIGAGVRKLKSTSTLAQDFEPEYIAVSDDSKKAWATLQENNAVAEINLVSNTVTNIWALGTKDFNVFGNGFDASDRIDEVHISNYPVKSYYIPDAVASFTVNNRTYLVTANEGDEKEYEGLEERTTVGAVNLDSIVFPNAAVLQENHNLGRLRITNLAGDTDKDGDFDQLFMVGARSFSIWDAETKTQVYDSGDDFERYTATHPDFSAIFNADNEDNERKGRSRAKGPEPEGLTVATINGATYAFVTLERIGGVMVYNITDPTHAKLVDYKNNRDLTTYAGDQGPEGIIYVSKNNSPTGKPYIIIANEVSGNISVFEIEERTQTISFAALTNKTLGNAPFTLSATATSGLPVSFSIVSGPATISGNTVTLTGVGTVVISATQAGNENYLAATPVQQSFEVTGTAINCTASGFITREQYNAANSFGTPVVSSLTSLEANNQGDFFVARILGYICPPQTGNYTFWISGDQATRLTLSTDANPANAQLIAYSFNPTNFHEYNKYATQKSALIYLEAGKKYYIEAQHAEFWGGDYVTVSWQLPDGTFEGSIPGNRLSPYVSDGEDAALAASTQALRMQMQEMNAIESATSPKGLVVHPNPFSDKTTIDYVAAEEGEVKLEVYTTTGELVRTLYKGQAKMGSLQQYVWDGSGLAAGVYVCRVTLNNKIEHKRIMLMK